LPRLRKALLAAVALIALGIVCEGRTSKFTGKIVAYDVMRHAAKDATFQQNQEVVVLETSGAKQKYVKVVFSSYGTTQIDQKYFDGTLPLEVDALRDHSCDERAPRFVTQASVEQIAGTYLLTDGFKDHPPARIKTLECYDAIYKKKKK
jgi:hypothetical protein